MISPYTQVMYDWSNEETDIYTSFILMGSALISAALFLIYSFTKVRFLWVIKIAINWYYNFNVLLFPSNYSLGTNSSIIFRIRKVQQVPLVFFFYENSDSRQVEKFYRNKTDEGVSETYWTSYSSVVPYHSMRVLFQWPAILDRVRFCAADRLPRHVLSLSRLQRSYLCRWATFLHKSWFDLDFDYDFFSFRKEETLTKYNYFSSIFNV